MTDKYRLIDLFAGAGGLTLGFTDKRFGSGAFECVFGIDNDPAAVRTHNANFGPHGICADIEQWLVAGREVPKADIVVGGPPCQGFSLLNKKRRDDHRRALWEPFLDIVGLSGASAFVIENVPGLLASPEYTAICRKADLLGFPELYSDVLNAANYGAPQTRRRAIIVGIKDASLRGRSFFPPPTTHLPPGTLASEPAWRTVRDAIADLPDPEGTEIRPLPPPLDLHFGRNPTPKSLARYQAVPAGGNRFDLQKNAPDLTPACWANKKTGSTDLFGRLWWDRPSVTIRTEFFKPEKGRYLHPDKNRPITHREAARLMGFPDEFHFLGTKIEIARQIGNAVPPQLGGAIARMLAAQLAARSSAVA